MENDDNKQDKTRLYIVIIDSVLYEILIYQNSANASSLKDR